MCSEVRVSGLWGVLQTRVPWGRSGYFLGSSQNKVPGGPSGYVGIGFRKRNLSHSPNSIRGVIYGVISETIKGLIKNNTRSLDYSSYAPKRHLDKT